MFYPKLSVHKVIISVSLVYTLCFIYTQCLFIDMMNRFNKIANIEDIEGKLGNRVHIYLL